MRHQLFGVRIDDVAPVDLDTKLGDWLAGDQARVIVTPNAEMLLEARKKPAFTQLLNRSDLALADSVSLQYAAAALCESGLMNRLPGVDLLEKLCEVASQRGITILLLGGATSSAEDCARQFRQRLSSLDVRALDPGQISWEGNELCIGTTLRDRINELSPRIVAVALGQHKQEQFIDQVRCGCPSVRIWIGVGGAFEMISGQKRRAPHVMSRLGLEWLWRLVIEPRRVKRILNASMLFPLLVAREAFCYGKLLRSTRNVFLEIYRQWFIYER